MSRPPSGPPSGVARGASFAAVKGVLLIGIAVVIGIVLLQVTSDEKTNSVGATTTPTKPKPTTTTTTTTAGETPTTPESTPTTPAKTPAELRFIVLNGGAATGHARTLDGKLAGVGYTNHTGDATTWQGHIQTGTTVLCKSGLSREATALVAAIMATGDQGVTAPPFPDVPPPQSDNADCVVVVGKGG